MMNKKSIFYLIIVFVIAYFIFPSLTFASANVKNTTLWNNTVKNNGRQVLDYGNGTYKDGTYKTKGYSKTRKLKYLGGFMDTTNSRRVFCIEPGVHFNSNATYKFELKDSIPALGNGWKITKTTQTELRKVMSCWYNLQNLKDNHKDIQNKEQALSAYVIATQAIVWELVTGERTSIGAIDILSKGKFAPNAKISGSLYDQINKHTLTKTAYQNVLKCAARYEVGGTDGYPSWSTVSTDKTKNSQALNYDLKRKKYTHTFSHGSSLEKNTLYNYYTFKIDGKSVDCLNSNGASYNGLWCKCNGAKCIFTSSKAISKTTPRQVTFEYTYKNDKKSKLFTTTDKYYTGSDTSGKLQTVMSGSLPHVYYLNLYTPQYQMRLTKTDDSNKALAGVKFDLYQGACSTTSGKLTTLTTNSSGIAKYDKLSAATTYCLKEVNTPEGYAPVKPTQFTVKSGNIAGSSSYAEVKIKNNKTKLKMEKYTIKDGVKTKLDDDYCEKQVCEDEENRENGPVFEIKKDGKKLCVANVTSGKEDGKYIYKSLSESCASGTTNKIRTCKGDFSIAGVPSGTYTVTETVPACGTTLPESPSTTVTVKSGKNAAVTMENGVTGIVFHKLNDNGIRLDGGKYSLQRKQDGVYKDILLKNTNGMEYVYSSDLNEETGTYLLETIDGVLNVKQLPVGDYRFVEKQAPSGFAAIKDKDSTAIFTVSDKYAAKDEYQNISLINRKDKVEGSSDSAELLVTIITGRRVINYVLIITSLAALLIILILLRRKYKR